MNHRRVFLYLVILLFLSFLVKAEANSPQAVVLQPIQVYGKDCDRASDLTTLEFRDGKTKKDWAVQVHRILTSVKYIHLGGNVI